MRSRILTALAAVGIAVAAPVVLAGCGEAKVTREEAAGCEASLRVLADRMDTYDGDGEVIGWALEDPRYEQLNQSIEDAESTVRAKCNERIFGVARSALPDGGGAISLSTICEADPYRETTLCASRPQQ